MADSPSSLQPLIQALLERDPPRAKSLCVTLLGDAIEPHGGNLWLSDLIELVTPLGINERLLRTSVFRLVAQDWLQSERHGRRSLYRLSAQGLALTRQASPRFYQGTPSQWDGGWTLVILPRFGNGSLDKRGELRRQLVWAGFGVIAPGVFALPRDHSDTARKVLAQMKVARHALILSAQDLNQPAGQPGNAADAKTENGKTAGKGGNATGYGYNSAGAQDGLAISELIAQCWDMEGVARQYQDFIETFSPMHAAAQSAMTPDQAFAVRALMLHEWRRIVLHDPQLPLQMLPADWPGLAARELCGQLYWTVFEQAESHLHSVLGKDTAYFLPLHPYVYKRFGARPGQTDDAQQNSQPRA